MSRRVILESTTVPGYGLSSSLFSFVRKKRWLICFFSSFREFFYYEMYSFNFNFSKKSFIHRRTETVPLGRCTEVAARDRIRLQYIH